ncbi:NAD(P)H-dependent oxidoreductase [Nonomuraea sp. NPDC049709]|uniref:NADPH-dependent FMN reductase n=1 Tax=Nonomuraea sp. NPDC049709 TaxID=3154736 RepID=UPI00341341FF
MIRIAIVIGSTRPRRRTAVAARWVAEVAARHEAGAAGRATFEVVDPAAYGLPVLDEPTPALFGEYRHPHTKAWAEAIASFDGFVFVTPEYNHSAPAALKNAIDFLHAEWNNKAAGFVSHGVHGGVRAVEHLRQVMTELQVANVRTQVALSAFTDFEITDPAEPGVIAPGPHQEPTLIELLDEVIAWSTALKALRAPVAA